MYVLDSWVMADRRKGTQRGREEEVTVADLYCIRPRGLVTYY